MLQNASAGAGGMTNRFPTPWRIVEMLTGFAVEDATGQQLGVFYGRSDPNTAGHTGFLTIDEARQLAVNFARLPELLERASAGIELAKAASQQSHILVRNGRHAPRQLEPLPGDLAQRSEILQPVRHRGAHQLASKAR
jgi:hypothetical protein